MVDLHRPPTHGRVPVLLWIHGGGFELGSAALDAGKCRWIVDRVGCAVAAVDYRLAPEHPFPAGLDDCLATLRWLHNEGDTLALDSSAIAIGGESAGGGLAASLALRARNESIPVAFQMLLNACLDHRCATGSMNRATEPRSFWQGRALASWRSYLGDGFPDPPAYATAILASDLSGLPPTYLMVGSLDAMRDEVVTYARRLRHAGIAVEIDIHPGAWHGFDTIVPDANVSRRARDVYLAALRRALFAPPPSTQDQRERPE
jgi:acetyl esterase/lipase